MSVQTQIDRISTEVSAQETLLDQALAAIANKAAGGGGSINTCTVILSPDSDAEIGEIAYTVLAANGEITCSFESDLSISGTSRTLENVVCGSLVFVWATGVSLGVNVAGLELVDFYAGFFKAPTTAGATGTITFIGED